MTVEVSEILRTGKEVEFGTIVVHDGLETVFVPNLLPMQGCRSCSFANLCRIGSDPRPRAETIPCTGGVYLDKMQYLQLKLVGDVK